MPVVLLCLMLVATAVCQTLPAGYDSKPGESYHWAGWSANEHYAPSRCTYTYDASVFPWTPPFTISRISVRPHEMHSYLRTHTVHDKQMRIKMSTDGSSANRPCYTFEDSLGKDRSYVLGDAAEWRTVQFAATGWSPIQLDKPFTVPAGARNLQVEFLVLDNSSREGTWYVDAAYSTRALDSGWPTALGGGCPETLRRPVAAGLWPGSDVIFSVPAEFMAVPVIGFLGVERPAPLQIGDCMFHPQVFAVLGTSSGVDRWAHFHFGRLPDKNHFTRRSLVFQAALVDQGLPVFGMFGFTPAVKVKIGEGWVAPLLPCSVVYSYGDTCPENPDQRFTGAYVSPRAPILKLN